MSGIFSTILDYGYSDWLVVSRIDCQFTFRYTPIIPCSHYSSISDLISDLASKPDYVHLRPCYTVKQVSR